MKAIRYALIAMFVLMSVAVGAPPEAAPDLYPIEVKALDGVAPVALVKGGEPLAKIYVMRPGVKPGLQHHRNTPTNVAVAHLQAFIKQATGVTGIGYLIAAHTAFCIPFAYMPIRARLEDMDLSLEQAAADLYAPPFKVFRRVTLPLMLPGILAGAMLAFIVSLDDVIITLFVAGPGETTLPLYILGQIRRGVTPEINAVSTAFVGISVILVTLIFLFGKDDK